MSPSISLRPRKALAVVSQESSTAGTDCGPASGIKHHRKKGRTRDIRRLARCGEVVWYIRPKCRVEESDCHKRGVLGRECSPLPQVLFLGCQHKWRSFEAVGKGSGHGPGRPRVPAIGVGGTEVGGNLFKS
jgi:hypothetical protein